MKTAVLFPGQGALKSGIGREKVEQCALFAHADQLLPFSLSALLCDEAADLTDTAIQQPALFVTSMARWQMWHETAHEIQVDYMAGHSMGEITALCAAGAISFEDGLKLVQIRGQLMKQVSDNRPGRMAAILKLDVNQVDALCEQTSDETNQLVTIANDNCPGQLVISGDEIAVNRVVVLAEMMGGRTRMLPVQVASHCAWMAEIADQFARAVQDVTIRMPDVPVVGNVSAVPLTTPAAIQDELTQQLTHRVRWTESMQWLISHSVDLMIDNGPGTILAGLLKRIDPAIERITTEH